MDTEFGKDNGFVSSRSYERYPHIKKTQLIVPYFSIVLLLFLAIMRFQKIDGIVIGSIIAVSGGIIRQIFILLENNRLILLLRDKNVELQNRKKEMEKLNKELKRVSLINEKEARTDFLTNLYNRRFINEKLKILYENAIKNQKSFSILILDIDHFKRINDNFGHDAGDTVLIEITDIIKRSTRDIDINGRFGGEEFIVVLPNTSSNDASIIAERIKVSIGKNNFNINNRSIKITTSVGGSELRLTDSKESIDTLLLRADKSLFQAKKDGRNKIVFRA